MSRRCGKAVLGSLTHLMDKGISMLKLKECVRQYADFKHIFEIRVLASLLIFPSTIFGCVAVHTKAMAKSNMAGN